MLKHFLVLGLDMNASDDVIRKKYLTLVRKHTPESDPERFRQITEAYESIKDERSRINEKLFGLFSIPDVKKEFDLLLDAKKLKRRRIGLKAIIKEKT